MKLVGGLGWLACLALAVACGSTSDDAGGGPTGVAIGDIPALFAEANCKAVTRCFGDALTLVAPGEDCEEGATAAVEDLLAEYEKRIDSGVLLYDGALVDACLKAFEDRDCNFAIEPEECRGVFEGAVKAGDDCTATAECVEGQYCKAAGACPGTCTALEAVGGACTHGDDCKDGLDCSSAGKCSTPAEAGDRCGAMNDPECSGGLFCVGADEMAGTSGNCRLLDEVLSATEGASCDPTTGGFCEASLRCVITGVDPTAGTLIASCAKPLASGAACNIGFPDPCPASEYCKTASMMLEGTCTARPKAGEACAATAFDSTPALCAPNTRCDGGTCRPRQGVGASCTVNDVCLSELCVDRKCALPGACG